jgi:hypothetical protein
MNARMLLWSAFSVRICARVSSIVSGGGHCACDCVCCFGWQSHSLKKDPSRGAFIESSLLLAIGVLNLLQCIHPLGIFCRCDFFFRPFSSDPPSLIGAAIEPWVWGPASPPPLSLPSWARGRPAAWRSSTAVLSPMASASASHNTASHVPLMMPAPRPNPGAGSDAERTMNENRQSKTQPIESPKTPNSTEISDGNRKNAERQRFL